MASNPDTDPVQAADSSGQNNDCSALEIPEYSIPSWFVSDNVKTAAQLSATEPKLVFSELPNNKNCPGRQDGAFTVCRQTFLSVRDTLASCLVRDADGEFPTHNIGAILSYSKEEIDQTSLIFAEYLDALAKELGAALVTLTLHDFQTLAAAFEDQTPAETRRALLKVEEDASRSSSCFHTHPAYRLVLRYFSKSSKAITGGGRWRHAFAAILNAQDGYTNGGRLDKSHEPGTSTTSIDQPLIVHIADSHEFQGKMNGDFVFARLRDSVVKAREDGQPVILVISGCAEDYELRKSGVVSSATFTIRYLGVPVTAEPAQKPDGINSTDSVNKLKFLLRWDSRQFFDSELLLPRTKWSFDHAITSSNVKLELDDKLLDSMAAQIKGRVLGGRKLTFEDIEQVVSQVLISTKAEREGFKAGGQESDTDSARDVSDDDQGSGSETDVREPSRKFKTDIYESQLLSSVIKVEELQDTKYEDVILNGDIKGMMRQLVQLSKMKIEAKSKHLLSSVQISGALLYGPPGTGKTHLSRAIANNMGSSMLALDSAALQCKYVGETEKYIRAAFSLARKLKPCIIFLDEVDALFYRRASSDRSWQRAALTQFLQEMDGLRAGQPGAPFVLVATNRPGDLDTAFLRRLPQKIYFGLPDTAARVQILRVLLNEEDLSPDVDIDELAALTDGYSGSDLKNVCAEAALLWVLGLSQKDAKEAAQRAEAEAEAEAEALRLTGAESSAKTGTSAAETGHGTMRDASNLDSGNATAGSEVANEATAEGEAGGEGHEAGRDETGDAPTNGTAAEKSKRLAKELRKEERRKERENRKTEREIKRREIEEQDKMEALYMERLSKVCLTKALFEKALQRMRPTVSKESILDMERFAQLYSNK